MSTLPTDAKERKDTPIYSGVLMYFPKALAEVARVSLAGNRQHFPEGTPLHWDKSKSTDEKDACVRHLMEAGKLDSDGVRHSAKAAWRALANLERELDEETLTVGVSLGNSYEPEIGKIVPMTASELRQWQRDATGYGYDLELFLNDVRGKNEAHST